MKRLSIITINYNNAKGLQKTLESVATHKKHTHIQYIVVDGASTDGSIAVINDYENIINILISEKDKGVYDAMNKGIEKATGEYLLFLNSGDHFTEGINLQELLKPIEGQDIIAYDIVLEGKARKIKKHPPQLSFSYLYTTSPAHQALLFRKNLFDQLGGYRTDLTIVSDWKFVLDVVVQLKASYLYIPQVMTTYYMDGMSSTPEGLQRGALEKQKILKEEYPAFIADYEKLKNFQKRRFQLLEAIEKGGSLRKKLTTAFLTLLSAGRRSQ